jgi:hypothetical protein
MPVSASGRNERLEAGEAPGQREKEGRAESVNGNHIRFLHAIEKDGIDLRDRGIYLAENAAQAAKLASYIERFPSEAAAHRADLKLAIGDVMVQAAMMCLDLGLSPQEIYNLGRQHVRERFDDFAERGWK